MNRINNNSSASPIHPILGKKEALINKITELKNRKLNLEKLIEKAKYQKVKIQRYRQNIREVENEIQLCEQKIDTLTTEYDEQSTSIKSTWLNAIVHSVGTVAAMPITCGFRLAEFATEHRALAFTGLALAAGQLFGAAAQSTTEGQALSTIRENLTSTVTTSSSNSQTTNSATSSETSSYFQTSPNSTAAVNTTNPSITPTNSTILNNNKLTNSNTQLNNSTLTNTSPAPITPLIQSTINNTINSTNTISNTINLTTTNKTTQNTNNITQSKPIFNSTTPTLDSTSSTKSITKNETFITNQPNSTSADLPKINLTNTSENAIRDNELIKLLNLTSEEIIKYNNLTEDLKNNLYRIKKLRNDNYKNIDDIKGIFDAFVNKQGKFNLKQDYSGNIKAHKKISALKNIKKQIICATNNAHKESFDVKLTWINATGDRITRDITCDGSKVFEIPANSTDFTIKHMGSHFNLGHDRKPIKNRDSINIGTPIYIVLTQTSIESFGKSSQEYYPKELINCAEELVENNAWVDLDLFTNHVIKEIDNNAPKIFIDKFKSYQRLAQKHINAEIRANTATAIGASAAALSAIAFAALILKNMKKRAAYAALGHNDDDIEYLDFNEPTDSIPLQEIQTENTNSNPNQSQSELFNIDGPSGSNVRHRNPNTPEVKIQFAESNDEYDEEECLNIGEPVDSIPLQRIKSRKSTAKTRGILKRYDKDKINIDRQENKKRINLSKKQLVCIAAGGVATFATAALASYGIAQLIPSNEIPDTGLPNPSNLTGSTNNELVCQIAENIWKHGGCVMTNITESCEKIQHCIANLTSYLDDYANYTTVHTIRSICYDAALQVFNRITNQTYEIPINAPTLYNVAGNFTTEDYFVQNVTACNNVLTGAQEIPT